MPDVLTDLGAEEVDLFLGGKALCHNLVKARSSFCFVSTAFCADRVQMLELLICASSVG